MILLEDYLIFNPKNKEFNFQNIKQNGFWGSKDNLYHSNINNYISTFNNLDKDKNSLKNNSEIFNFFKLFSLKVDSHYKITENDIKKFESYNKAKLNNGKNEEFTKYLIYILNKNYMQKESIIDKPNHNNFCSLASQRIINNDKIILLFSIFNIYNNERSLDFYIQEDSFRNEIEDIYKQVAFNYLHNNGTYLYSKIYKHIKGQNPVLKLNKYTRLTNQDTYGLPEDLKSIERLENNLLTHIQNAFDNEKIIYLNSLPQTKTYKARIEYPYLIEYKNNKINDYFLNKILEDNQLKVGFFKNAGWWIKNHPKTSSIIISIIVGIIIYWYYTSSGQPLPTPSNNKSIFNNIDINNSTTNANTSQITSNDVSADSIPIIKSNDKTPIESTIIDLVENPKKVIEEENNWEMIYKIFYWICENKITSIAILTPAIIFAIKYFKIDIKKFNPINYIKSLWLSIKNSFPRNSKRIEDYSFIEKKRMTITKDGKIKEIDSIEICIIPFLQGNIQTQSITLKSNILDNIDLFNHIKNVSALNIYNEANLSFIDAINKSKSNIIFSIFPFGNYTILSFIKNKSNILSFLINQDIINNINNIGKASIKSITKLIILQLKLNNENNESINININKDSNNAFTNIIDNINNNDYKYICNTLNVDGNIGWPCLINILNEIQEENNNDFPINITKIPDLLLTYNNNNYGFILDGNNIIKLIYKQVTNENNPQELPVAKKNIEDDLNINNDNTQFKFFTGAAGIGSLALLFSSDIYKSYIQEFIQLHPIAGSILAPILNNPKISATVLTLLAAKHKNIFNALLKFIRGKKNNE